MSRRRLRLRGWNGSEASPAAAVRDRPPRGLGCPECLRTAAGAPAALSPPPMTCFPVTGTGGPSMEERLSRSYPNVPTGLFVPVE
ncbi:hypothetical protein GCM10017600_43030 [Streptosporangium carneum]|uniref:Uncharacterized protein n=1 Tax=Streptosporangium carneum TaxID=47481 RepID=A0A9W6I3B3_9ACTN|nr:hypothetical protein GCM10017600_43030 [Streptosporangium carneum]